MNNPYVSLDGKNAKPESDPEGGWRKRKMTLVGLLGTSGIVGLVALILVVYGNEVFGSTSLPCDFLL